MQVPDSWLAESFNAVIGTLLAGIAWLGKNTWGRIRRLEDCAARKQDLEKLRSEIARNHESAIQKEQFFDFAERAETDRKELREGLVSLGDKVDDIKDILIAKNRDG